MFPEMTRSLLATTLRSASADRIPVRTAMLTVTAKPNASRCPNVHLLFMSSLLQAFEHRMNAQDRNPSLLPRPAVGHRHPANERRSAVVDCHETFGRQLHVSVELTQCQADERLSISGQNDPSGI